MIKKRNKLTIILLAAFALLVILYFAVISPIIKKAGGSSDGNTELLRGEVLDGSGQIMMFERIEQTNLASIEVHNGYGTWTVYRANDDKFYIKDHESIPYNVNSFASLVISAGYTISLDRVTTDCEDFSEFGLAEENSPAWFVIKSTDGAEHKVYIGDQIPTLGGYYARYDGRDAVYILAKDVASTLLAPANAIAHPMLTYPVSSTTYYTAKNFYIVKDGKFVVWIDSYDDSSAKQESISSQQSYKMVYPEGFVPNATTYGSIMTKFTEFTGQGVVELGPELSDIAANADEQTKELLDAVSAYGKVEAEVNSAEYQLLCVDQITTLMRALFGKETLDKYGLYEPKAVMHYTYNDVESFVLFSDTQEDGYRYAYSALWNTIVAVKPDDVSFLDWNLLQFVDSSLFSINIENVSELYFESPEITETFKLSGSGDSMSVTPASTGKAFDEFDLYNFKSFYRSLLMIELQDYTASKSTDNHMLSFTVKTSGGGSYTFDFYRYSARRCFYTINGVGEFYVLSDSVEKAISDCVKVMNSQDVDSWAKN